MPQFTTDLPLWVIVAFAKGIGNSELREVIHWYKWEDIEMCVHVCCKRQSIIVLLAIIHWWYLDLYTFCCG